MPVVRPAAGMPRSTAPIYSSSASRRGGVTAGPEARFAAQAALLRDALRRSAPTPGSAELPGEYRPGRHSVTPAARIKVADRAARDPPRRAHHAVVVVGGARGCAR